SYNDLGQLFGPQEQTPDNKVVPSLIYSSTRALTMQALKVMNTARGTAGGQNNPSSHFARRFHPCTGDLTKVDVIKNFAGDEVAVISCTMALGLGQNWKRVRMVSHFGQGDPASLFQMIGRCGRDGKPGLAVMFVEPNRRNGKNCVEDFEYDDPTNPSEDDRMDAFAITPVCLRITFSLDNLLGYIPVKCDDPNVLLEKERETTCGFVECRCSNCKPEEASVIIRNLKNVDVDNFTSFLDSPSDFPPRARMEQNPLITTSLDPGPVTFPVLETIRPGAAKKPLLSELETFATYLFSRFKDFYASNYDLEATYFTAEEVFSKQEARLAVLATEKGFPREKLEKLIGDNMFTGHMEFVHTCIEDYRGTEAYQEYTRLKDSNMSKKSTRKKTNPQSSRMEPVNTLNHLDPSLFESTSSLHQAPKLTKKQQTAEDNKKKAAAKQEMKQAQKAVNEQKKKENLKEKKEAQLKKRQADQMSKENRKEESTKRKANKDVIKAAQAKRRKTTSGELERFHLSQN
ncbi:hypothetical protein H4Q26_008195, partial [Puccinia striiformis f. sp. tritici PST-130]